MVYVTGDLHGDLSRFSAPPMRAVRKGDTLVVCGDFGFIWEGSKKEKKILKKLGSLPYTLAFLDGRHENYELLAAYETGEWNGGRAQVIEGNLVHLLRGECYTIEGETYFTFGGGESDDPELRAEAKTWWEEEMPSEEEMRHGLDTLAAHGNQVDYILTHEPSAKASGYLVRGGRINGVHVYLNQIEDTVRFKRWFFGCLHMDKTMSRQHRAVFRDVVPVHESHQKKKR